MRIAQVAPLYESVPPKLYGGTERVVSWLTEELVDQGHEVTLFASGDSQTRARLIPACPHALWRDKDCRETLPHHVRLMELVFEDVSRFDVLHFHCDYLHFPLLRRHPCPSVTTLHGRLHVPDQGPLFAEYRDVPLVSISNDQRRPLPDANWHATVHHGLPRCLHPFQERPGDYLAFLGRMSPEKRVDRAIEIARLAGMKLKIAAKTYRFDAGRMARDYVAVYRRLVKGKAAPFCHGLLSNSRLAQRTRIQTAECWRVSIVKRETGYNRNAFRSLTRNHDRLE